QAEDGIRDRTVTGVQTCALPILTTEIDGIVKYGEISKGTRKINIIGDDGEQKEYAIPRGVHINVQEGERVKHGDPLMDGPRNPRSEERRVGKECKSRWSPDD